MDLGLPVLIVVGAAVVVTALFAGVRRGGGDHPSPDRPDAGHDEGVPDPPRAGWDRGAGPDAEATLADEPGGPTPGDPGAQEAGVQDAAPPSAAEGDEER